jgi:predicted 3-demethylubiquinone-9 3-methyltransferase (glyoxalase superfamily)
VVRLPGRRSREVLHRDIQELEDHHRHALRRRREGDSRKAGGIRHDGRVRAERAAFTALNGGPLFTFNEAISFQIMCADQEEVDYYWNRLTQGGDPSAQQCGWLKDKFGVSWQVVPTGMVEMMNHPDRKKADRVMEAMLRMKKLDIAALEAAFAG